MIKKQIKKAIEIITKPKDEFVNLRDRSLENVLGDYLKLALACGIAASIFDFLISIGKSVFYDIVRNVDIEYFRMMNYASGKSVAIIFLYLFSATFFMFILSIILYPFFRKMKYVEFLKILFYSFSPVLLFSWITPAIPGLVIWAIILFIQGIRNEFSTKVKEKGTIHERD